MFPLAKMRFTTQKTAARHRRSHRLSTFLRWEALEPRTLLSIAVQFDFSEDTSNFFDTQMKKDVLQAAACAVTSELSDNLLAIQASGGDWWTEDFPNPSTGAEQTVGDGKTAAGSPTVPANTLVIYVGARALGAGVDGKGTTGASNDCCGSDWQNTVTARGQAGALATPPTDFGPWGGSIAFDNSIATKWYFGMDTSGLQSDEVDFFSRAEHELGHVLGFGTSHSWDNDARGGSFIGANAKTANGGQPVPLDPTTAQQHWAAGTKSNGQFAAMDPRLQLGTRADFTQLDFAGLADIGWQVQQVPTFIIQPHFPGEKVDTVNRVFDLNSAQVDVLFEGTSWNDTNEGRITSDIQAIVNSKYLSRLSQYTPMCGDVTAAFGPGHVYEDHTPSPDNVDIPGLNADVERAFNNSGDVIAKPAQGKPTPIYVMVVDASDNGGRDLNRFDPNATNKDGSPNPDATIVDGIAVHEILIRPRLMANGAIDEDLLTLGVSHELAENMAVGVTVDQPLQFQPTIVNGKTEDPNTQIADGEPEIFEPLVSLAPDAPIRMYAARLNGTGPLVQAYWSEDENDGKGGKGAFVVPDGSPETVTKVPVWNGTEFTGKFDPLPPGATTLSSSSVTSTGATFNAIVNPDGSATNTFFEYSTGPNLPANVVTTLAGTAGQAGGADGVGAAARLNEPNGVAVDVAGNVYVADTFNDTIREITAGGVVTTLAGTAGVPGSVDGVGTAALFNDPTAVAVDDAGNIYVADAGNDTIREIAPGGVVTTLAGTAGVADSVDGKGALARFNHPSSVAVDGEGNVYVADTYNNTIREITPDGVVTTLAGTANVAGSVDGTGAAALFDNPYGIAVDDAGNIYVGDTLNDTVREITPGGVVTTLAGAAGQSGNTDGTGAAARLNDPNGVAVDGAGNVYVADYGNHLIREITPGGVVITLAGTVGETGGADGTGPAARFNRPTGVAVDGAGNVFVADTENDTIRKLSIPSVSARSGLTGTNPLALTAAVTDLLPDTICYERVVATSAGGTTLGAILSFTTAAKPLPPPPTILSVQHPTIKVPSGKSSKSVTVLQLQFSEPVKGAGKLADYALKSGKTKNGVTTYTVTVPLTAAVYNYRNSFYTAPRNTVTLFLKGKLNLATPERLSVIASSITDSLGQPLARRVVSKGGVSIQWR
jgi:hypothetical protein